MPESKPKTDIIMVTTDTGIVPYCPFWKRLFIEHTPAAAAYKGQAGNTLELQLEEVRQGAAAGHDATLPEHTSHSPHGETAVSNLFGREGLLGGLG